MAKGLSAEAARVAVDKLSGWRLAKGGKHGARRGGEEQFARRERPGRPFRHHRLASRGRVGCRGSGVSILWPAGKLARLH